MNVAVFAALMVGASMVPVGAAQPTILTITTPDGAETRNVAPGSAVTVTIEGDGQANASARVFEQRAADADERVIVELRGATLVRRSGSRARAPQADRDAVAGEHRRVRDEIARLTGRPAARSAGGAVTQEFSLVFNGLAATLTRNAQNVLRGHPDVKAIHPDTTVRAILDTSVPFVGAPTFWAQHGGYRGAGEVIAVIDTGVDYTHADVGACSAVGGSCKVMGGYDFHNGDADPRDDNGHGTHVAATAAGNGALLGVAPDAKVLAFKVLDQYGNGYTSNVIAGIEASVDPNGDLDTSDHADVANLSLGGPGNPDDPGSQAVDAATAAGELVVVAAGNSGGYRTIGSPGTARTALTVGAVDETPARANFTSGGPTTGTYELKPEISAPGVGICAARAQGTQLGDTCMDATHIEISGTSMATPHVAGAAALLRGVFPALAPADVKSLLVQNSSTALSDDALKIGAGILDIPAAAAAHTTVSPQAPSFGLDDITQATWIATRTLTVRNISASARNYGLSATGFYWGLPAGASIAFSPASFSLSAGQSTNVTVQLTVDNSLAPDQSSRPNAYEAMVTLQSGSEAQRIPLIFLKTSVLRVHTDQVASLVYAHDRMFLYTGQAVQPTGNVADLLVPAGTWDVMVVFPNGLNAYVVHEGVVVSGLHDEYVNATEAVHTVSLSGTDELGQPLADGVRSYAVAHRASGLGITTITNDVSAPFAIAANTLSADYDVDLAVASFAPTKSYLVTKGVTGVAASHALDNTAAELTHGTVVYYPKPGEVGVSRTDYLQYIVSVLFGFGIGYVSPSPLLSHDVYLTPAPHPRSRSFLGTEVSSANDGHRGPFYRAAAPGVLESYNLFDVDRPVASTTTGELPINLGPASFFASFLNTDIWLSLQWVAGSYVWTFHDQGGDGPDAPGGTIGWRLFSGNTEVASGITPQSSFGGPFLPIIDPAAAGPFRFETDPLPYYVAGLPATSRITATFDTSLFPIADVNPPYLKSVTVRSTGLLTDTVAAGASATVGIEAHDEADEAGLVLSLARIEGSGTTPIPLTPLGGGRYEAVMLDACDDAGPVNLLIVATDSTGNELSEWLTPAFACRPATCGNGTTEPGEACDDGNLVSGDGCNSVCSSTEVCGDGVQDSGEQCDDGNTADGDGCSATCEDETIPMCPPIPQSCRSPVASAKAYLSLTNRTPDGKDQLQWKWAAGAATTKSDFGDPLNIDHYVLCLYDGTGYRTTLTAPAGGLCHGKPCWKDKPKGFQYKDKDATPNGLTHVQLSAGASGKAKIQVKGRGVNLPDLGLTSLTSPVTVQLMPVNGSGVCFGATYTFPPAIRNDAVSFKDKGQ